jgi:hypothetical protein
MDSLLKEPIDLCRIDTIEDVGRVLGDIVAAVASGKLTPRDGVLISKIVEARRKAFESIDFKKQMDELKQEFDDDRTAKP